MACGLRPLAPGHGGPGALARQSLARLSWRCQLAIQELLKQLLEPRAYGAPF
eukprot:NODE_16648_length_307_cov_5.794574_g15481_i0.p3 GENE.NODE_16648_length_307_cov_5.794574_g15481_i0~~NODE_16648_length_307_cov_5.794574_g15481_i0.p3  ORF type:complete len:52 (+),score=6.86 NODE_16648_length_307_cov_5.794574_g15481_i0:1-156(+)